MLHRKWWEAPLRLCVTFEKASVSYRELYFFPQTSFLINFQLALLLNLKISRLLRTWPRANAIASAPSSPGLESRWTLFFQYVCKLKKNSVKIDLSDFRLSAQVLSACCHITDFSLCTLSKCHVSCKCFLLYFQLRLELFYTFNQKSTQLLSAQKLSALFPLRKFCCVANLVFKCLAWQVCLAS